MNKITDIVGKQVISIFECEVVGTIFSFQMSKENNKITYLWIEGVDGEQVFLLPCNKIWAIADCVLIKNNSALSIAVDSPTSAIMNALVVDTAGKYWGNVIDIEFDERYTVLSFVTKLSRFLPPKVLQCEANLVIINSGEYSTQNFKPKPQKIVKKPTNEVSIS